MNVNIYNIPQVTVKKPTVVLSAKPAAAPLTIKGRMTFATNRFLWNIY